MKKSTRGMSLVIVIALLMPILVIGIQNTAEQPSIWIVYTENPDDSMALAGQTFKNEMISAGCLVGETTLNLLDNIPKYSDSITVIGHGYEEGVAVSDGILSWSSLYETIESWSPLHTIVLACHSPTIRESNIFGFGGVIDAEAGALIATWHARQVFELDSIDRTPYSRAIEAQEALEHPLSRVVYFVHGYFGDILDFSAMKNDLEFRGLIGEDDSLYDEFIDFSYLDAYDAYTAYEMNVVHHDTSISEYATNFANQILQDCAPGTQVSIVAHSLGGIITRQMLMQDRTNLEAAGIDFGAVITFGTPHLGTNLADTDLFLANLIHLAIYIPYAQYWPSPILTSLCPGSDFLNTLNDNPVTYSNGIRWYTAAGIDPVGSGLLWLLHLEQSDPLVAVSKAKLSFADSAPTFSGLGHSALIEGHEETYSSVESWLSYDVDSDDDGLTNDMETYMYGTDCYDSDTDNDGLTDDVEVYGTYGTDPLNPDCDNDGLLDGDEVYLYNTLPTAWSTDGDILSDSQEVAWGYDPNNTYDPINAPSLTYSTWQVNGATGYVRANHYTAMDYVKVYVKYKNNYGQWTGNMLVGTDYTPTYYDDYYLSWSLLSGYVQMLVTVQAFDSANHYLGCDTQYVTLPYDGGGGKPGGDPVPI